jgi:hypothetical protein
MVYLEPIKTNIITKKRTAYSQYASMQCLFFSKICIFTSGSQVCVDYLENSRPLSLDMNEYSGTEIIVAFRDNPSSLETQKKNLVTILHRVIR